MDISGFISTATSIITAILNVAPMVAPQLKQLWELFFGAGTFTPEQRTEISQRLDQHVSEFNAAVERRRAEDEQPF